MTCQEYTATACDLAFGGVRDSDFLAPDRKFKAGRKAGGLVRTQRNEVSFSTTSFHLLSSPLNCPEQK